MEFELVLEPVVRADDGDGIVAGEFRNQNKAGETYRRTLIDTPKLSLKVALLGHGKIVPGGSEASLLVFDFRLTPSKTTQRFKWASFEVLFRDTDGDDLADPEVYRVSPEGTFAVNPWTLSANVKKTFELGGNIGLPQAGLNAKFGQEREETKAAEYSVTVIGRSMVSERVSGEPNTVYWEMHEDKKKRAGTPTFLRTAVILERKKPGRRFTFSIKAETDAKVTLIDQARSKTVSFLGRTGRPQPALIGDVEINPPTDLLKAQDEVLSAYADKIVWDKLHELNLRGDVVQHTEKEVL